MGALTWLDGGLATALQREGLPPYTPVDGWLRDHPERVAAAHRAFVDAGAEIVLAGTFRCWTDPELAADAIRLARGSARPGSRTVLGLRPAGSRSVLALPAPGSTDSSSGPPFDPAHAASPGASGEVAVWVSVGPGPLDHLAALAACAASEAVDGIVLETFVDPEALAHAVREVRRTWSGPLVASLVPPARSAQSGSDRWDRSAPPDLEPDLAALVEAGADGVGFNCGWTPEQVLDAIERAGDPGAPLWARPAGGPRVVEVLVALAARCRWIGGCCGVSAAEIAAARVAHAARSADRGPADG